MTGATRSCPALSFAGAAVLLALGLSPLPGGWARSIRDLARSPELNRADREADAGGYYEGLIGGGAGPEGSHSALALRLLGKPADWVRFDQSGVARRLPKDFLQFDLQPNQDCLLFGRRFTTNAFGLRDRPYSFAKPAGVFRVALLGSSIDMGWGVATEETYENRLEDWLNAQAVKRGLNHRFEILNFAVAAYGPAQRLESFRRKAAAFQPDLVLYSSTMLDPRLLEIHLCGLLAGMLDLRYDFLRQAVADARLTDHDLLHDSQSNLIHKETVKAKLRPFYWSITDASLGVLAAECRTRDLPLICLIIPRAGQADAPEARALAVARHQAIAARHALPVIDLSATFDAEDPTAIELAAWDDHPNTRGHKLLFLALARALAADEGLSRLFFDE
jgi:hypothetical protein